MKIDMPITDIRIIVRDATFPDIIITQFHSGIVPRIGEKVYFPHIGLFKVLRVAYSITDEREDSENEILFAEIYVKEDK